MIYALFSLTWGSPHLSPYGHLWRYNQRRQSPMAADAMPGVRGADMKRVVYRGYLFI